MARLSCSAPGKLVLVGEYAVLFGHPAAVLAVDRRATVELSNTPGPEFSVFAPGLVSDPVRFGLGDDGGTVVWHGPEGAGLPLVETVLGAILAGDLVDGARLKPFDAVLDTRAFFDSTAGPEPKLGLGSSAALTVALASAVVLWADNGDVMEPRIAWLDRLLRLHREFQGGRGSGIDLAASLFGGVLEYRLDDDGTIGAAEPIELPDDLHTAFVWTRRSADTNSFLARLSAVMETDRAAVDRAMDRLAAIAGQAIAALRNSETAVFLEAVDGFYDGMQRLGKVTGLQIVSDVHVELHKLAARHGARYKPSGAGGGDMGMVFADNGRTFDSAVQSILDGGYKMLDLSVDPSGLLVEQ